MFPSSAQNSPTVRLAPFDPRGDCTGSGFILNTNTGAATQCIGGRWTLQRQGTGIQLVSVLPRECFPGAIPFPLLLLAARNPAVYACMTKNRWTPVGPNVYVASHYPSLAAAVAAAGNTSEILLTDGYTAILDAPLQLSGEGVTLRCAPGARIVKGFSGDAIQVTGQNITIDGCSIDGAGNSYSGGLIMCEAARGMQLHASTVFGAAGFGIAIYASIDVTISASIIEQNGGSPIFAQDLIDHLEISSNTIDSSAAVAGGVDTIGVHTYVDGGSATNIDIHDNTIVHGGDNFAIEVGSFGVSSLPPANVDVENNTITLARQSNGGISFNVLTGASISGNSINAGGYTMGIDGIELVSTSNVSVINNTIVNTEQNTTYSLAINGGSGNLIQNNTIACGIYVGTSRVSWPTVDSNIIQGNTLTISPVAALPRGLIWFQCNTPQCSVSNNQVISNVLNGNNSGVGINFENDDGQAGGRMDSNQVTANQITGATQAVNIGSGVTNTQVGGGD